MCLSINILLLNDCKFSSTLKKLSTHCAHWMPLFVTQSDFWDTGQWSLGIHTAWHDYRSNGVLKYSMGFKFYCYHIRKKKQVKYMATDYLWHKIRYMCVVCRILLLSTKKYGQIFYRVISNDKIQNRNY